MKTSLIIFKLPPHSQRNTGERIGRVFFRLIILLYDNYKDKRRMSRVFTPSTFCGSFARQEMISAGLPDPALHPGPAIYQVMILDTVFLNGSLMESAMVCLLN